MSRVAGSVNARTSVIGMRKLNGLFCFLEMGRIEGGDTKALNSVTTGMRTLNGFVCFLDMAIEGGRRRTKNGNRRWKAIEGGRRCEH